MRAEEQLGQMENFMKSMADDTSTRTTRLRSLIDEVEQHGQELGKLKLLHDEGIKGVHELLHTGDQNLKSSLTTLQGAVTRIETELGDTVKHMGGFGTRYNRR